MHVEVLRKTDSEIVLFVKDYPLEYVNSIRRIALSEVPVMAIDYVYFIDNSTVLYDEILAHRLGLVPLASEKALDKYRAPEECADCDNCENCYVRLYIDVEAKDKHLTVYSGDLRSDDPDVYPVQPNIPIVILAPGQKLVLEAYARLGRGREHAKWNASSVAVSKYGINLYFDINKTSRKEECLECISRFSSELADVITKRSKGKAEIIDESNTSLLYYCSKKICGTEAIRLEYDPSKLILKIESTGSLPPERIVVESTKILEDKLYKLLDIISGEES